jgi:branched-chain amino acid transport system permease protein
VSVTEGSAGSAPTPNGLAKLSGDLEARLIRPRVYAQHQWAAWLGAVVIAGLVPLVVTSGYAYNIAITAALFALLSLGFYFQFALGGQFSFATPAYYATGAYVFAWAVPSCGFLLAFLIASVITAVLGALTKLLLVRSPLIHFAIATLAFGELVLIVFQNWTSFTGGGQGKYGIPMPSIFGLQIDTNTKEYYLCAAVVLIAIALLILFERSPAQRDLVFVRDMGQVARTSGLRAHYIQIVAFAGGASFMGAAGALLSSTAGFVSTTSFQTQDNVSIALLVLLMVLLGGTGVVWGPVIGAIVLITLAQALSNLQSSEELIYAIAILVIILVLPGGITSLPSEFKVLRSKMKLRRGPA